MYNPNESNANCSNQSQNTPPLNRGLLRLPDAESEERRISYLKAAKAARAISNRKLLYEDVQTPSNYSTTPMVFVTKPTDERKAWQYSPPQMSAYNQSPISSGCQSPSSQGPYMHVHKPMDYMTLPMLHGPERLLFGSTDDEYEFSQSETDSSMGDDQSDEEDTSMELSWMHSSLVLPTLPPPYGTCPASRLPISGPPASRRNQIAAAQLNRPTRFLKPGETLPPRIYETTNKARTIGAERRLMNPMANIRYGGRLAPHDRMNPDFNPITDYKQPMQPLHKSASFEKFNSDDLYKAQQDQLKAVQEAEENMLKWIKVAIEKNVQLSRMETIGTGEKHENVNKQESSPQQISPVKQSPISGEPSLPSAQESFAPPQTSSVNQSSISSEQTNLNDTEPDITRSQPVNLTIMQTDMLPQLDLSTMFNSTNEYSPLHLSSVNDPPFPYTRPLPFAQESPKITSDNHSPISSGPLLPSAQESASPKITSDNHAPISSGPPLPFAQESSPTRQISTANHTPISCRRTLRSEQDASSIQSPDLLPKLVPPWEKSVLEKTAQEAEENMVKFIKEAIDINVQKRLDEQTIAKLSRTELNGTGGNNGSLLKRCPLRALPGLQQSISSRHQSPTAQTKMRCRILQPGEILPPRIYEITNKAKTLCAERRLMNPMAHIRHGGRLAPQDRRHPDFNPITDYKQAMQPLQKSKSFLKFDCDNPYRPETKMRGKRILQPKELLPPRIYQTRNRANTLCAERRLMNPMAHIRHGGRLPPQNQMQPDFKPISDYKQPMQPLQKSRSFQKFNYGNLHKAQTKNRGRILQRNENLPPRIYETTNKAKTLCAERRLMNPMGHIRHGSRLPPQGQIQPDFNPITDYKQPMHPLQKSKSYQKFNIDCQHPAQVKRRDRILQHREMLPPRIYEATNKARTIGAERRLMNPMANIRHGGRLEPKDRMYPDFNPITDYKQSMQPLLNSISFQEFTCDDLYI